MPTATAFKSFLLRWKGVPLSFFLVLGGTVGLRLAGAFQVWEWRTYDLLLRSQSPRKSPFVTIVEIRESDIQRYFYPINDSILADALRRIDDLEPRAIGVSLIRDLPLKPELEAVLRERETIIGVTNKAQGIAGPAALPSDRIAANDIYRDADGIVRRIQLYPFVTYTLGMKLAQLYLEAESIDETAIDSWQFGEQKLVPLSSNSGPYVRARTSGFEILLPYQGRAGSFDSLSLQELLEGQFDSTLIEDRIVLIGPNASSIRDGFLTPFSASSGRQLPPRETPAVHLHAHLAAGLLEAGFGDMPLRRFLPEPIEYAWFVLIGLLQSVLLVRSHSAPLELALPSIAGGALLLGGVVVASGYVVFASGWWLPVVPALFAIAGVATVGTFCNFIIRLREDRESLRSVLLAQEEGVQLGFLFRALQHELRGQLAYIVNSAVSIRLFVLEGLGEDMDDAELAQLIAGNLDLVEDSGRSLIATLDSLLTEQGDRPTSLNAMVCEVCKLVTSQFRQEQLLDMQPQLQLDESLDADLQVPLYFSVVIGNLVRNAFEAQLESPEPALTVLTRRVGDAIFLSVADNGPGIPDDLRSKIFNLSVSSKLGEHRGLGLYLVGVLLKRAGGKIAVSCPSEGGTVFEIRLPSPPSKD